jgi:hypothetical protein
MQSGCGVLRGLRSFTHSRGSPAGPLGDQATDDRMRTSEAFGACRFGGWVILLGRLLIYIAVAVFDYKCTCVKLLLTFKSCRVVRPANLPAMS